MSGKHKENTPKKTQTVNENSASHGFDEYILRHEKAFVCLISIMGMLRVLFFSAAFPFFNNIDEQMHFDLVVKYSNGYLSRKDNDHFSDESARLIALYGTPEYFQKPGSKVPAPVWSLPEERMERIMNKNTAFIESQQNHETTSPPVYYFIAGMWYKAGKFFGCQGGELLYWTRFFNICIFGLLIFFSYLYCKELSEGNLNLRLGVVSLLAFFPQDLFYSINSDVLSPFLFLISLYLLNRIYMTAQSIGFYFVTGVMVALTYLTKLSNLPILAVLIIYLATMYTKQIKQGDLKAHLLRLFTLTLAALIPITVWHGWNLYALSDFMGTKAKIESLGWTLKPLGMIWDHPVFSTKGAAYFLSELIKTFWRGEFVWETKRLAYGSVDLFYVVSSLVLPAVPLIGYFQRNRDGHPIQNITKLNVFMILLFILFFMYLSIRYDFGDCWYPSRDAPYLTSGRLMSGVLVPFLIVYVQGLIRLVTKIKQYVNPLVVIIIIAMVITWTEISLTCPILKSHYNWFHLVS